MNKKLSRPVLISIQLIWFLITIFGATFITTATKLPMWSLLFPVINVYLYGFDKISKFDPQINKPAFLSKISAMSAKDKMIFWISTLGISIISVLEGFFLKLKGENTDVLVFILNSALWIGIQWVSSPNLRKVIINRE